MSGNWIAVASAEHVRRGRTEGFLQVCHGKVAPLRRIKPGDRVVYYSPTVEFRGKNRVQAFTAIGLVPPGEPYAFDMGGGFCPWRRDVRWLAAHEAPIQPLLDALEFSAGKRNWASALRFGLLAISAHDWHVIVRAMGARFAG
jgi:hypothetical protein